MKNLNKRSWAEPYKMKMVELLKMTTKQERVKAIKEAGFNTFLLKSEDVYIDLLTDSGTNSMSDRQWGAFMTGDEAYAGSKSFYKMEAAIMKYYGYKYVIPTHQGRAAENILSKILIKKGDIVPGNMYFTTTRLHQELAGGTFTDIIIDEAHDPLSEHQFKGNVDFSKLDKVVKKYGSKKIAYISIATNVNLAGGQPVSMANLKELRAYTKKHKIRIIHDMTRVAENAYSIKQIVLEICSLTDGATMSAKKDALVNIGGFLATNEWNVYEEARNLVVVYEGLHTYGGLAGRDMEAIALGIEESLDDNHQHARVGQVEYLGHKMMEYNIPIVQPIGGHGIFVDAKAFLPHLTQDQFPAQTLAAEMYIDSGVRTMERGIVSAGRKANGDNYYPKLELVRFTIPRRVYTQAHMDVIAESAAAVYDRRKSIKGLRIICNEIKSTAYVFYPECTFSYLFI
jgi:tyrosine phenol-lyase